MRYPHDYNTVPRLYFWLFHLLWLFPWSVYLPAVFKLSFKPVDRAAVFTISDQPTLVSPLAPAEIAAAKLLTIPAATTRVPTAFYDTVVAAAKYLVEQSADRHRRVIVVISDGDDNTSSIVREVARAEAHASQKKEPAQKQPAPQDPTRAEIYQKDLANRRLAVVEVQRLVQQADAAFYSVNPGGPSIHLNDISMRAQNAMDSIAQSTGGTAYVPDGEKDLERVFNEVAAELRGQYLLQYYSNSQTPGTRFRRIAVGVLAHPEVRVRARQGYYPKAK